MKPAVINRGLLVIAFLGIFVAGVLSLSHVLKLVVPCGAAGGCEQVTNHESAFWFNVPVAYFGFVGYLGFAALALFRSAGLGSERLLTRIGLYGAGVGAFVSLVLQYIAFTEIKSVCWWCIASAVLMTLNLVGHYLLDLEAPAEEETGVKPDFILAAGLAVVAGLAIAGTALTMKQAEVGFKSTSVTSGVELVPKERNVFGDDKAPITIVEFADLCCPACKALGPQVKDFVREHDGKVRLVYRHWPLAMHPNALPAAIISEHAAEKGKFWEFFAEAVKVPDDPTSARPYLEIAAMLDLDVEEIKAKIGDDTDKRFMRVYRDIQAADKLGLKSTPTFIIMMEGQEPRAVLGKSVFEILKQSPYKQVLNP
ncbi:MAG: vitamin K epoxide reductase family protein [Fimbriimonas sp.]